MTHTESQSKRRLLVAALIVGLILASALALMRETQAVETDGTVQACVNRVTKNLVVRDSCTQYEDWLLIEGVYNNPAPPPRPTLAAR